MSVRYLTRGKVRLGLVVVAVCATQLAVAGEFAGRGASGAYSAVYRIMCPDRNRGGTAFAHESGKVLTAEHVVRGCDPAELILIDRTGRRSGVTVLATDVDVDLALLEASEPDFVSGGYKLASDDVSVTVGSQVSTWGFPGGYSGQLAVLSVGYFAGVEDMPTLNGKTVRRWLINGAFNRGNSGGPLLETNTATVLGVVQSKKTPMPPDLQVKLTKLKKSRRENDRAVAELLEYQWGQTQLMIGLATMAKDVRKFMVDHGVQP